MDQFSNHIVFLPNHFNCYSLK